MAETGPRSSREYCLSTKTYRVLEVVFSLTQNNPKGIAHRDIQEKFWAMYQDCVESPTLSSILTRFSDKGILKRVYRGRRPRNIFYVFNFDSYAEPVVAYKDWVWKNYGKVFDW